MTSPSRKLRLAVPYLLPYRCYSPTCRIKFRDIRGIVHYLPGPQEPCPNCGERTHLRPLAVIHLIQPAQFGIVKVSSWSEIHALPEAARYDFLCEKSKKGYKDLPKSPDRPRHYTSSPSAATCYYCLKEYNRVNFPRGSLVTEF